MADLDTLVEGLRAAGEPTRLRLLVLLSRAELTVSELTLILKQSQPRVSRHLKLLTDAGLIDRYREGTWVFYRAREDSEMARLKESLLSLLSPTQTDSVLARDNERLEGVRAHRTQQAQAYFAANAATWNKLRAMHVDESVVETAILSLVAGRSFENHLDIGTGTGRIIELLAPTANRSLGVDLSPEMLAFARSRLSQAGVTKAQVRLADLFDLPATDHSFDLVTLHQVLHYLDEPARAVAEAARVLAPGGQLLIADFAPHEHETLRNEHQHRRLGFANTEVATWFANAGLKLVNTHELPPGHTGGLTVSLWLATSPQMAKTRRLEKAHS